MLIILATTIIDSNSTQQPVHIEQILMPIQVKSPFNIVQVPVLNSVIKFVQPSVTLDSPKYLYLHILKH
jgi:hypothetical protein